VKYGWSDDESMAANNSSGFNYRYIAGTDKLSQHAYGRAIDINPLFNPYIRGDVVDPPGGVYDPSRPGTLVAGDAIVQAFEARGWTWGGRWDTRKDWHHFEKPV
jgi:peptidoglycan L-alanyl-D-glutamate endopeptidase CwlK